MYFYEFLVDVFSLIVLGIEVPVCKQCRPSSDAAVSAASELGLHCLHMSSDRIAKIKLDSCKNCTPTSNRRNN